MMIKRFLAILGLLIALGVIVFDSAYHFDEKRILLKRKNNSGQTNWSMFYGQRFVYYDGALRYNEDFAELSKLIEPGYVILSDKATSYYAAANLPAYVLNIQRHHGLWRSPLWNKAIRSGMHCTLNSDRSNTEFRLLLESEKIKLDIEPTLRYILVNHDSNNKNVRSDCFSIRRNLQEGAIKKLFDTVYVGKYLTLYALK